MVSLISTSLSDATPFSNSNRLLVFRFGISLLFFFFSSCIFSQVLINEVITEPQQDWSAGSFLNASPGGSPGSDDEWIELYIDANNLDLTGWQITVDDGTPFSGDLTSSGAFSVVNYIGSGSIDNTVSGDYLILGNPVGSAAINNTNLTITLEDDSSPSRIIIDQVEIDGSSGTMFSGNSNDPTDESVCRIPNGQDTDVEADDFVKTRATLGTTNSPNGTVLINEVVTDPQQDWSGGSFADPAPGGSAAGVGTDEWIELYIGTSGLNLTKWNITIDDGVMFSGDLTSSGAFQVVNYVGSGSFINTQEGDYLVLGNPTGSQAMNNDVFIELFHPDGTLVDDVEIGDDIEGDGAGDGAHDGTASGGDANNVDDESVARIANGVDTDNDINDFQQVRSTLGSENGISMVYVDATATDDNGLGTVGDPKQLIQSGIDLVLSGGTVNVSSGSYSETLTISKSLTLNGANQGIAGSGTRGTESALDVSGVAITSTSDDVTIDGFQLGTDASDSDITNGVVASGSNVSITNNIIYANSLGISVGAASSGTVDVSDNVVSMLAVEDATSPTNGSVGIFLGSVSGTADADLTDNNIANASTGIVAYGLTSSTEAVIDGGTIAGCTTGILPTNADGLGGFSPSTMTLQNITMSGFTTDLDVGGTETGVYAFVTGSATTDDDLTVTMDNLDISGTGNTASNYSGIVIGDFPSATDGISIDATITNCNIHDNSNRGIYTRGEDATTIISQSSITGNGFDPIATGGNPGFSVIARENSSTTVSNCFITNSATLSSPEDIPSNYYVSGLHISTGGSLTVSNSNLNDNGNGFIAETAGIDLSGNYFNSTTEATIDAAVGSNDFTPWLASGTDTDGGTAGFQGDLSGLMVGVSGAQTGSSGRIEEAIGLVDASGTVTVNAGTYPESLTIAKSLTLNGANQGVTGNDGGRGAESIIEPSSASVGITIGASDITIDGFQFGTDNGTSNNTTGISNTGFAGFTGNNNRVFANASGMLVIGISSGAVSLTDNYIEMLGLANPLSTTSASIGLGMINISGDADIDFIDNDINTATYGIATFGLTSSTTSEIDGGAYSGCTIGISTSNFDGSASFSASTLNISNVTMSGFAGPDGGITGASGIPQAGIYAFTTASAPSTDHDLIINADTVDISGVGNGATDYAAIYAGDFFNTDPDLEVSDDKGITMTVSNSNIHDNTNRGVHSRGGDAVVNINTSTISNSTNAGGVVFARGTLNIDNTFVILPSSGATSGLLAQTDGQIVVNNSSFDLNGNVDASTLLANIQDPAGDEIINISGSWLTTTDEATIISLVDESDTDFSPWLGLNTDSDGTALGFQPDLSSLYVGTGGSQSAGLISEAHDLLTTGGTIMINSDDYAETLTVSKNISLEPVSSVSIDDVILNGGNLNILNNTLTINNSITMTDGVFDIDQEDGNKSDDPVFVLPGTVNGSSFDNNTHFEGRIERSITGTSSYTFEVGDEGAYRPVTLTPTTTTTFQVAHIAEATPVGAGATNPNIEDLKGEVSANPSGTIVTVLNFRYWDIDVAGGGPPGNTDVALQITAGDNATDPSSLGMTRFDGADWEIMTLESATGAGPFVITGSTSDFSEFSIYSTNATANPLPVELMKFTGERNETGILLSWTTLIEINSDHFQLERSTDGISFDAIGKVSANGNSNKRIGYQFYDKEVRSDIYYYRLKMVDYDDSFEYSPIIMVVPNLSDLSLKIFPNPVSDFVFIDLANDAYLKTAYFYDLNGRLHKSVDHISVGILPVADLPAGVYLMRLEMVDGKVYEGKIVKE